MNYRIYRVNCFPSQGARILTCKPGSKATLKFLFPAARHRQVRLIIN